MTLSLALLAHPAEDEVLMHWVKRQKASLVGFRLVATAPLIERLRDETDDEEDDLAPILTSIDGDGADIAIAAEVLRGEHAGVLFFADPQGPVVPDLALLLRVCHDRNVPLATTAATADLLLRGLVHSRTAHLIFNPVAGQGNANQELSLIRSLLEPQILVHVVMTQPDQDPADQARAIVEGIQARNGDGTGIDSCGATSITSMILASGGDGTVSAVAGAVIGTGVPLGVIPRGTANAFSVALGIPTDIRGACSTILTGHTRVLDAARCNDIPMVLLAGLGFEAGMVDRASRELKNVLGPLAYVLAGAQQFADQDIFTARLEIDGQASEMQTAAITVANVAPATSVMAQGFGTVIPDDGLLEITIATSPTRMQGLSALASLFTSAVVHSPTAREDLLCLRGRTIRIETDPPQKLVIDGELVEANPVSIECIPGSLQVLTPLKAS